MNMKPVKAICLFTLVAAAAVCLSFCSTTSTFTTGPNIQSSFTDSYAYKTYLQNDSITLHTEDRKVTLTGSVSDESHRLLAEKILNNMAYVKKVDNKLQVEGGIPAKGSDAWLGSQVKAEIMSHPDVNAKDTEVYVKDKVVTLRGQVDNAAQKTLMAGYALNVKDVKKVVDELTVAAAATEPTLGQAQSDALTTSNVSAALYGNPSTNNLDATINTSGGVVTVLGYAYNKNEKDLVTTIISGVPGVKAVDNKMIVETPTSYLK